MKKLKSLFLGYLKDEEGQTSTEYILLLLVVAVVIFKFKETLSRELEGLTKKIFGQAFGSIADEIGNK